MENVWQMYLAEPVLASMVRGRLPPEKITNSVQSDHAQKGFDLPRKLVEFASTTLDGVTLYLPTPYAKRLSKFNDLESNRFIDFQIDLIQEPWQRTAQEKFRPSIDRFM